MRKNETPSNQIDFEKLHARALFVAKRSNYPYLAEDFAQYLCLRILEGSLPDVKALDFKFFHFCRTQHGRPGEGSARVGIYALSLDRINPDTGSTIHELIPGGFPNPEEALELSEFIKDQAKQIEQAVKIEKTVAPHTKFSQTMLDLFRFMKKSCDKNGIIRISLRQYVQAKKLKHQTTCLQVQRLIEMGLINKESYGVYRILSEDETELLPQYFERQTRRKRLRGLK